MMLICEYRKIGSSKMEKPAKVSKKPMKGKVIQKTVQKPKVLPKTNVVVQQPIVQKRQVKKPDLYVHIKDVKSKPLKKALSECDRDAVRLWLDQNVSFPREMDGQMNLLRNSLYMALDFFVDREKRKDKPYLYDLVHMMKLFIVKSNFYMQSSEEWMKGNQLIFPSISLFFIHTVQLIQQSDTLEGHFIRNLLSIRQNPSFFSAKEEYFGSDVFHNEAQRVDLKMDEFSFILLDILNYE